MIRLRGAQRKNSVSGHDEFWAVDLDRKSAFSDDELIPASVRAPPPFDFERLTRFMAYGFLMAPVQHRWFAFLARTFPITKGSGTVPAMKRVAFDQFLFAPIGLACFFTYMTVAEGGGKRAVMRKFQDVYIPALKANFMVWPAVQILNFRIIPIQFQIVCSFPQLIQYHNTDKFSSLLSQLSVSPGLPTSLSRTPPMRSKQLTQATIDFSVSLRTSSRPFED